MNPYYDSDTLGWTQLEIQEEPDYDFNILCFWKTKTGLVFSASDSGCSCPCPFEDYCGKDETEVLQKLERVGSLEQAEQIIDGWKDFSRSVSGGLAEMRDLKTKLRDWFK